MTTSAACAAVNSAPVTRSSAVVRRSAVSFGGRLAGWLLVQVQFRLCRETGLVRSANKQPEE